MEQTALTALSLTPDLRHLPVVKPRVLNKGIAVTVPREIVKKYGILAERTEYILRVQSDGTLIYSPRPRATPWAISPGAEE